MARNNRIHPMLSNLPPSRMRRGKVVSAGEAVRAIRTAIPSQPARFVSIGVPEEILKRIETSYLETENREISPCSIQQRARATAATGAQPLRPRGLVKRVVGGHWGLVPKLGRLAMENKNRGLQPPRASSRTCSGTLRPTSPGH